MTRQDFETIARVLAAVPADTAADLNMKRDIVGNLCAVFQGNYPNFQPARFVAACLIENPPTTRSNP